MICTKRIFGVVLAVALMATPLWAEELKNLDATGGASEGHWVMLVSQRDAEKSPTGAAIIAAGKDDEQKAGFGAIPTEGAAVLGEISKDAIAKVRESESTPTTLTTIVKVSPDQYTAIVAVLQKHAQEKSEFVTPEATVMNAADDIVKALEFKRPYRSRRTNPQDYFKDFATLNRKHV